ncbi:putative lipid II flippase MurJ [bacterium HR29]|nr:putative lipid II flippase MurJ [bacterium HR29]
MAAAIVAAGFLGSRLLGVLRTVAIARAFGASPELDAYQVAFRIPDLIFQVLAGATLGSAFIPVFARTLRSEGEERAWLLASRAFNLVTAATAALCLAGWALAPALVPLFAPGLGADIGRREELVAEAVFLTRLMLLSPLLFAMSGMVTGILNARERFLYPAIAPMLYNLAIIFGALVLAEPLGVRGLAVGVVCGAALHFAVQLPGLWQERMRYRPSLTWADPAVREVGRLMAPRVAGLAAAQVNVYFIATYFGSRVGAGAIASLNYAWIVANLPLAVFGMAVSTAAFPRLAAIAAEGDWEALRAQTSRLLRLIMFFTVPAAVGLALLREPVVEVLLQRGAFTAGDTRVTAAALGWYCLGIVPQAGIEIHSRAFYALGDTRTPVVMALAALAVNAALSAVLWEPFGVSGLAFAVSAASWLEWGGLWTLAARRLGDGTTEDLHALARVAVAAGTMGVAIAAGFGTRHEGSTLEAFVDAFLGAAAGALAYFAMAALLQVPEVYELAERAATQLQRLRGRLPRNGGPA